MMEIEQLRNRLSIVASIGCVALILGLTFWGKPSNVFHTQSLEMSWWLLTAIIVFYMFGQAATAIIAMIPKKDKTQ